MFIGGLRRWGVVVRYPGRSCGAVGVEELSRRESPRVGRVAHLVSAQGWFAEVVLEASLLALE